ncbi:hypothetical protein L4O28_006406 [Pseudomonas aeruginosa]|uniref:hypothetical protein n=1 Tax=Pseudomonas aeruginosa TaxID=287 RepID=UPI000F53E68B|nr:hypothetical protein [Pseudomonas aeruginosa]EKX6243486.1 hypothetical protein [Pseudomonas aeruginosa]RQH87531.1 hypothetical protein IPC96_30245 [Pseudomonas aeruginosa]HBP0146459.1 hypothetical protein [Pseudomonas aeruginosa]
MKSHRIIGGDGAALIELISSRLARAQAHDWGALVDAYLFDAAKVGNRIVAYVYEDLSGALDNGMTVVTPPVELVSEIDDMALFRSLTGSDNYVLVSRLPV